MKIFRRTGEGHCAALTRCCIVLIERPTRSPLNMLFCPMSRLFIARTLNGFGVMGATIGVAVSLAGILGVIATTSATCPDRVGLARCSSAGHKAAGLAAYGFIGAGLAGSLLMAGRVVDPEA